MGKFIMPGLVDERGDASCFVVVQSALFIESAPILTATTNLEHETMGEIPWADGKVVIPDLVD
jgi:hypothetical protein